MHHVKSVVVICLTLFSLSCATTAKQTAHGWTTLFDGAGLDQWEQVEGGEWSIEEGALIGRNGVNWSTNPEETGSYLRTKKAYGDFELSLEYAINQRGNSGVFFRCAKEKNPAFTGYEMQITDAHGRDVNEKNSGLYDVVGISKNVIKPTGEWNHAIIRAFGQQISITLNGEQVVTHTGDRRLVGHIGLQNHDEHSMVKFRNVKIREL
ncbi:MAG: DUF1080 domain-containing protein [Candidatus Hinthialibacter antarcticus]|nr:DUF1080 domain-containing protein [Candidatus Hinthialibacter antarcticus]